MNKQAKGLFTYLFWTYLFWIFIGVCIGLYLGTKFGCRFLGG